MSDFKKISEHLTRSGQVQALGNELDMCIRSLQVLERRQALQQSDGVRLADLVLALDSVKKRAGRARAKAQEGDLAARMIVADIARIEREVGDGLKSYAKVQRDYSCVIEPLRWARGVLAAAKQKRTAPTKPRATQRKIAAPLTLRRIARKSAEGRPQVVLTASSDSVDLDRDRFSVNALREMATGLKGRAAWIGHSYSLPNDLFGKITGSAIVPKGGKTLLDLTVEVATENARAEKVVELIRAGFPVGASVGVIVLRTSPDKSDGDITIFESVRPLEVSVVGLPANFDDAWVQGTKGRKTTLDNLVVA